MKHALFGGLCLDPVQILLRHFLQLCLAVGLEQITLPIGQRNLNILHTGIVFLVVGTQGFISYALRTALAVICFINSRALFAGQQYILHGLLADAACGVEIPQIRPAGSIICVDLALCILRDRQIQPLKFLFNGNILQAVLSCLVLDPFLDGQTLYHFALDGLLQFLVGFIGRIVEVLGLCQDLQSIKIGVNGVVDVDAGTDLHTVHLHYICRSLTASEKGKQHDHRQQRRCAFFQNVHGIPPAIFEIKYLLIILYFSAIVHRFGEKNLISTKIS